MVYRQNAISMIIYYKPPDKSPRPPDKSVYWKTIFFIFHPNTYVVGTQKNRLNETFL